MKKHPILLCYLPSSFLRCILVVFALLIFSGPAEAMPRVYPYLLLSPCGEDAYNVTGPGCDNPDDHWNFTIHMLKHPTDAYQNACKSFLHPASKAAPPLSTTSVSFIFTDNAAAGRKIPATSYATLNVAAQEPGIDPGESNRQSPLKAGLLNLGIRGTLSSFDVIGADAPEEFRAYDVAATFRLPWGWYSQSDWGAGIRLMTGVGALTGGGDTGLVVSLMPLLAFGSRDGRFTLDMGAGVALFSRHTFGTQDFGGHFQFTLTAGVGVPLFKGLGAGYRFVHYSDASLYGHHTTGADLHMLEITYRF